MREPILTASELRFSYATQDVLENVSCSVYPGEYLGVIGPNGSGKTTLFQLLSGHFAPERGTVKLDGREIRSIPIRMRARSLALVAQRQSLDFPFTCLETVLLGLHPHRARFERVSAADFAEARTMMEQTEVWHLAEKRVSEVSGGELQRVILSRALMQRPRLLLLDEAMSELDVSARIAMMKLLRTQIEQTGMTVIGIHHDLALTYRYCDRILALKDGRVAGDGTPDAVFTPTFFETVFAVHAEILPGQGFLIYDNIKGEKL